MPLGVRAMLDLAQVLIFGAGLSYSDPLDGLVAQNPLDGRNDDAHSLSLDPGRYDRFSPSTSSGCMAWVHVRHPRLTS